MDNKTSKPGEALKRDWEQTKNDLSRGRKGEDLDQQVTDTLKQSVGKERVPPEGVPNSDFDREK